MTDVLFRLLSWTQTYSSPPSLSLGSRRRTSSTSTSRSGQHRISPRLRSVPRLHELELDGEVEDDVADVPRVGSVVMPSKTRMKSGEGQSGVNEEEGVWCGRGETHRTGGGNQ